ncbi:FAD:protein FMN transferase [Pedobacter sp. BS3]|uniref:FAD:protein FMN transferase n=1 Tax=Pedobacter sp. BS3 TaxID=2567937 RepID=UPI0011EBE91D|nr:FAD:protein FMN transferase [Pedobacter sp. BS3]TZF81425.1 FAD:protein FMN transferase [Pedobacter sp. BS3]
MSHISIRNVALCLACLLALYGATPGLGIKPYHISGYAQGTTYHVTYYATDSIITKAAIENLLAEIDSSLSIYKPYSLISRFNESQSGLIADKYLQAVTKKSLEVYKETGGIFDITVYPLVRAWGFGTKKVTGLPDSTTISALMQCIGSGKIHLNANHLIKDDPCVKLDVNGIAQGYSVDVLALFLEKKGIRCYMAEIGGELRVKGKKPDGTYMKVGIEGPADNSFDAPVIERIMTLKKGAITTAGNYRKYYQNGNKRISHLLDARTGYPIQNEMISVTIVAKDAITADGYDSPLMGMHINEALAFMKRHKDMQAYFIYHRPDGSVADTATKGFYKLLQ